MSHIKITIPGMSSIGTEIEIDGIKQNLVCNAELRIPVDGDPTLLIERYLSGAEIEGAARIDEMIIVPTTDGPKRYRLIGVENE